MSANPDGRTQEGLRIKYEVPLPWLIGGVVFIAGQAATVWFSQQSLTESNRDLVQQIRSLSVQLNGKDIKDVQHDLQLADHERRMLAIEALRSKP